LAGWQLIFDSHPSAQQPAAIEIKAPLAGIISCAVNTAIPDTVVDISPLKTLHIQFHEKGHERGAKRSLELLMPVESANKVEAMVPELVSTTRGHAKEARGEEEDGGGGVKQTWRSRRSQVSGMPDKPPSWKEQYEAKKAELKGAALGADSLARALSGCGGLGPPPAATVIYPRASIHCASLHTFPTG
jgi:hypothetical protein